MQKQLTLFLLLTLLAPLRAQVNYTANQIVVPYTGKFRPGINLGYYPNWDNKSLADLAAGNPAVGQKGIGARSNRAGMYEIILDFYGYGLVEPDIQHWNNLGMGEYTAILGGPTGLHQDYTQFCPGKFSNLFSNLYTPVWDGGAGGTPYNDNNYWAAYLYKVVSKYKDQVRFWEIWNEPGLDLTGQLGWRDQNYPGNWWAEGPNPCDNILHAPIYHYIRILRIAWDVIKTVDPDGYVCLGSVGYQSFLNAVLSNTDNPQQGDVSPEYPLGGGAYFDCISYHSYPHFDGSTTNAGIGYFERHSDAAADGIVKYRDYYQLILDKYGYDGLTYPKKEWIITEINSPRKAYTGAFFAGKDEQINHMMKAFMVAKINKIHQLHTFQLVDQRADWESNYEFHQMGLYKKFENNAPYNVSVNDEGIALKTMTDLIYNTEFDPARTAAMNLPPNVRGYAWRRPDGAWIYAVWALTENDFSEQSFAFYSFPASFNLSKVTRYDWDHGYTGFSQEVSSQNIFLNARPLFFTGTPGAPNCLLTPVVSNVQCWDNNTPTLPNDDQFTFTLTVNGTNSSGLWTAMIAGQSVGGAVGVPSTFGPYPIAGGNLATVIFDGASNLCAAEVLISAPAPCSDELPDYCPSESQNPQRDWISRVSMSNLSYGSGMSEYSDFSAQTINVIPGMSYPVNLRAAFETESYDEYWKVWIDYNRNGVFEEPSETAYQGFMAHSTYAVKSKSISGVITLPQNAPLGKTRIRVSMKRGAYPTPCEVFANGEVEDYGINIQPGVEGPSLPMQQRNPFRTETGIEREQHTTAEALRLSPNPATAYTLLDLSLREGRDLRLRVSDFSGRTVLIRDLPLASPMYYLPVDDFPAGIYRVEVTDGQSWKAAGKLCVVK